MKQVAIRATYMRGGTSKGVFFNVQDLPLEAQQAGEARDALLLRAIGSPDPYAKHTDGMGGATSSTSKTVLVSKSNKADHDVDYLFGQVAIDKAMIDWSGNCGNLTAAVAGFAIDQGMIDEDKLVQDGFVLVRIWQVNIGKSIHVKVPMQAGSVQELGDFELDGVTFPAAEVQVSFIDPVDATSKMFPTGQVQEVFEVPSVASLNVTFINAGIPTVFVQAQDLGFDGTELQPDINQNAELLTKLELIRAHAAIKMGLISDIEEAKTRQHTPKIAWVSKPQSYTASSGKEVREQDIDILVRAMSMGQLHHAMMGTAAVAIGVASVVPGTLLNEIAASNGSKTIDQVNFGHPSGTLKVGAKVSKSESGDWLANEVIMSRSSRRLMQGNLFVPQVW